MPVFLLSPFSFQFDLAPRPWLHHTVSGVASKKPPILMITVDNDELVMHHFLFFTACII